HPPAERMGRDSDPAEETEDSTAAPTADLIPDEVRGERGRKYSAEGEGQAHASRASQRTHAQEDGHGRDRQTNLFRQHEGGENQVTVLRQDFEGLAHWARLIGSVYVTTCRRRCRRPRR